MTREEKQLLLKDICARLPYGVCVLVHDTFKYSTVPYENVYLKSSDTSSLIDSISLNERYNSKDKRFNRIIKEHKDFLEFKPYLRPMSSMAEKEMRDWLTYKQIGTSWEEDSRSIDWINAHHFDYRGLIPMDLAIEAPEGMYNKH